MSQAIQTDLNKSHPVSLEAERSVLGGLILDNATWDKIVDLVNDQDFYDRRHQLIFKHIQKLAQSATPYDVVTLADSIQNDRMIDQVGGLAYIAEIVNQTPTAANIVTYSEIVQERARLRRLLGVIGNITEKIYLPDGHKSDQILDYAEQQILSISQNTANVKGGPVYVNDILVSVIDRLDLIMEHEGGITGASSGFKDLDEKLSGLHGSNLLIVAGRPSMGKTTFAMNIAENVARTASKPVVVFSLEMPSEDLVLRMLSSLSRVDQTLLRAGNLNDEHWASITAAMKIITEEMKLYIDDSPALTPLEVRNRSRRLFREHDGLSLVIVDYLQLMRSPGYENNRTQEVSEISRSLKALSKELDVPVIALSQLNRGVDDRADKRPMMSDLRESGAIEQDADVIMFVYRDEVYHRDKEDNKGMAEIIIGKQRNGPIGVVNVTFQGRFCRFDSYIEPMTAY